MKVGPLEEITEEDFRETMEINCFGPLHSVLAVLPEMRRQGCQKQRTEFPNRIAGAVP